MLTGLWFGWVASLAFAADGDSLSLGERYGHAAGWTGNAYTVEGGRVMLHPLLRSAIGIGRQVDLKSSFLGLLLGPNLSTEVAFLSREGLAISIEPRFSDTWGFNYTRLGGALKVTAGGERLRLTGGLLVEHLNSRRTPDGLQTREQGIDQVRPEVTVELDFNEQSALAVHGRSNLIRWTEGAPEFALGAFYLRAGRSVGWSAGANLGFVDVSELSEALEQASVESPFERDVVPMVGPHLQLWFRL